jgi:hypothetical protein
MTETLAENKCTPCRGGISPLTRDEAQRLQAQAPDWELADDAHRVKRTSGRGRRDGSGRGHPAGGSRRAFPEAEMDVTRTTTVRAFPVEEFAKLAAAAPSF